MTKRGALSLIAALGMIGLAQTAAAEVTAAQRNLRPGRMVAQPKALSPAAAPSDLFQGAPGYVSTVFSYPSSNSTIVGSVGFINAEEVGYFWSVSRGDSVTETFSAGPSIVGYKLDVDVVSNALNSGAFVNWNVLINGVLVDNFTVNEGFIGTVSRTASFPAIAGPNYTVQMRVTNEVAGGQGSHTFRYAGVGAHQVELLDQTDPVVYLQLNEFPDCYVLKVRASQKLVYGDIPVYASIFTGGYGEGRATLGWTNDGGATAQLTVFKAGFTEELWEYDPAGGFTMVGTATWRFADSCPTPESERPHQVK
jgi:hypothetical protein